MTRKWAIPLLILAAGGCAPAGRGARMPAGQTGLWAGPIHLCRDSVAEAIAGSDSFGSHAALRVVLAPAARHRLRKATKDRVGRTMAIRLDGRLLQEPRINEPILGGTLMLAGSSKEEVEAMRAATRRAC